MKDYTNIECCRLCKSNKLQKVYSLGEQTLTGVFPQSKNEIISSGPVDLLKCQSCGLVQLKQTYNQCFLIIFREGSGDVLPIEIRG